MNPILKWMWIRPDTIVTLDVWLFGSIRLRPLNSSNHITHHPIIRRRIGTSIFAQDPICIGNFNQNQNGLSSVKAPTFAARYWMYFRWQSCRSFEPEIKIKIMAHDLHPASWMDYIYVSDTVSPLRARHVMPQRKWMRFAPRKNCQYLITHSR